MATSKRTVGVRVLDLLAYGNNPGSMSYNLPRGNHCSFEAAEQKNKNVVSMDNTRFHKKQIYRITVIAVAGLRLTII